MARGRRSSASVKNTANPLNRLLDQLMAPAPAFHQPVLPGFATAPDLRRWDPSPAVRAWHVTGKKHHRLVVPDRTSKFNVITPSPVIAFEDPKSMVVCRRRSTRREVIFANRKAGKGARQRRRRRNELSGISCR